MAFYYKMFVGGLDKVPFAHPPDFRGQELLPGKAFFPKFLIGFDTVNLIFVYRDMFDYRVTKNNVKIIVLKRDFSTLIQEDSLKPVFFVGSLQRMLSNIRHV